MIKYHGTPLTPMSVFNDAMKGKNCLIPYTAPQDLDKALLLCNKVIIDNGAYTVWRKKIKIDWKDYYTWIKSIYNDIEGFFIPDVIDGSEEENNTLIAVLMLYHHELKDKAIPVWHIDETLGRLEYLMSIFNYVAIGSSGEYAKLGTTKWHNRMEEVMNIVCDNDGKPKVKIHMLRCLDSKIFTKYPFYSGDSTNLARNHNRYNSIRGNKAEGIKASNDGWKYLLHHIESKNSPTSYIREERIDYGHYN